MVEFLRIKLLQETQEERGMKMKIKAVEMSDLNKNYDEYLQRNVLKLSLHAAVWTQDQFKVKYLFPDSGSVSTFFQTGFVFHSALG